MNASAQGSIVRAAPCSGNESAPPAKKAKGAEPRPQVPKVIPETHTQLRKLPATTIHAIMEKYHLPFYGLKLDNISALVKHMKAMKELQHPTAPTNNPNEEAPSPLLCEGYKFENRGNESPVRADLGLTIEEVRHSVHGNLGDRWGPIEHAPP